MPAHSNYLEQKVEPDGKCLSVFQGTLPIFVLLKNLPHYTEGTRADEVYSKGFHELFERVEQFYPVPKLVYTW